MTDVEFKSLSRKRSSAKAQLTQFTNFLKGLPKDVLTVNDADVLATKIERMSLLLSEFRSLQTKIELIAPEETLEAQFAEREAIEDAMLKQIVLGKARLKKEKTVQHADDDQAPVAAEMFNVKLPTITLPKFDGKADCWIEFRDSFLSLIHNNKAIDNIQRYHYLRSSLKGDAAEVIKSIEFSNAGYILAWRAVCERYNNTRLIIHTHLNALFSLDAVAKETASNLRSLVDTISKHLWALGELKLPVDKWDEMIIFMVTQKLDLNTAREWEKLEKSDRDRPTLDEMKNFLRSRADLLETVENHKVRGKPGTSAKALFTQKGGCWQCNGSGHSIAACPQILNANVTERIEMVRRLKACINCLRRGHGLKGCRSKPCNICNGKHHHILHVNEVQKNTAPPVQGRTQVALTAHGEGQVLLSTAQIIVKDKDGKNLLVRALLDSGSQTSFITNHLCQRLKLNRIAASTAILGINSVNSRALQTCTVEVKSRLCEYQTDVTCAILQEICGSLPNKPCNPTTWRIPKNVRLADPNFSTPGKVEMLIGADHFWYVLCHGSYKLGLNLPVLQNTQFGYLVSGPLGDAEETRVTRCHFSANGEISEQLERFWIDEECSTIRSLSQEEALCEKHFKESTMRNKDGRFVVKMPLKEDVEKLGESRMQAERRFLALERRMAKNANFKEIYCKFMSEYESLGHMKRVNTLIDNEGSSTYYAPHHGVFKEESTTTKLRVVFDCSAKSSSGLSLNDIQMVGPTIQEDLLSIVLRFRRHTYVVTGDIAKMYRQILMTPEHRSLQRILWRSRPTEPLGSFELSTVTYGTAAAAFLAVRCIHALAEECKESSPVTAAILTSDFYVDDLLTGGDNREELIEHCKDLMKVLRGGCFDLRKWNSNDNSLLREITRESGSDEFLDLGEHQSTKTLGLVWSPRSDTLMYKINEYAGSSEITKRMMLSRVAQIFDPLGLLSPCIILAKIMLQKLWLEKLGWDDVLPSNLLDTWSSFEAQLHELNAIAIPRKVFIEHCQRIELHGFSDASEAAFGACIYIRSTSASGCIQSQLLCAKSKVAPLKTLTIPRLELCGATLLVRLARKVIAALKANIDHVTLWTDSTIVLGWINTVPIQLKTYVSNRVADIQGFEQPHVWRHIPTMHNPADLVSRGVCPVKLKASSLWWQGPAWLPMDNNEWPPIMPNINDVPDLRSPVKALLAKTPNEDFPFTKFSNLNKLRRIIAYVFRFCTNASTPPANRVTGPLTTKELKTTLVRLVKIAQMVSFPHDIAAFSNGETVKKGSKLLGLNPFLDPDGVLRVGGRLNSSDLHEDRKHPMVMCSKHPLTVLIFESEHKRLLHAGPQLLLSSIRQTIWPIAGRNLAKKITRNCVKCFRTDPKCVNPIMGNLPSQRISANFPFQNVGVDYAGPIMVKDRKGRGAKSTKHYICLFICFAVKAIHLELVSELTTEGFLAALRRFVSRRGKPIRIYSDNGTNFVGANAELKELASFIKTNGNVIREASANEGIEWRFIPPRSPHQGGLWERGVRSVKYHLRRITGSALFTYEQYYTLLVQVESILNSRPLCPLSSDPNDFQPLTPAHFLIGRPITAVPEEDLSDAKESRLVRYQHIQYVLQHFWKRWSKEYLSELHPRSKWKVGDSGLALDSLVLVRDDNLPPLHWKLGRVCEIHPGQDGIIRVASVKTSNGIIKRATSKLCPLPLNDTPDHGVEIRGVSTGGGCTET